MAVQPAGHSEVSPAQAFTAGVALVIGVSVVGDTATAFDATRAVCGTISATRWPLAQ